MLAKNIIVKDNTSYDLQIKNTSIFAPKGFKNTPIKYIESTPYIEHVGNEAQYGSLELTYSAIAIIQKNRIGELEKQIDYEYS